MIIKKLIPEKKVKLEKGDGFEILRVLNAHKNIMRR